MGLSHWLFREQDEIINVKILPEIYKKSINVRLLLIHGVTK